MLPTPVLSAGGLLLGYAVAAGTGVRALGGVVLVLAGVLCERQWRRLPDPTRWTLVGIYVAAFVLSHVLAIVLGAWPSVIAVSLGMAVAAVGVERAPVRSS